MHNTCTPGNQYTVYSCTHCKDGEDGKGIYFLSTRISKPIKQKKTNIFKIFVLKLFMLINKIMADAEIKNKKFDEIESHKKTYNIVCVDQKKSNLTSQNTNDESQEDTNIFLSIIKGLFVFIALIIIMMI